MSTLKRILLCVAILLFGVAAHAGLERLNQTERPLLRNKLETIPLRLGQWTGRDEKVDADIVERAQTTEYLNRVYDNPSYPGLALRLWINYSREGTNLRHTPEICLPSGGWSKIESQSKEITIDQGNGSSTMITHLGYSQAELVEHVGFWYYIFGEGKLENYVRRLPITSRSSHGQTTRGSSMTVEVFYKGDNDPEGEALKDFASQLLKSLELLLPIDRAAYHIP
jgi:hypothetical protein